MTGRALVLALLCGCAAGPRPSPAASSAEPTGALAQARAHTEELARVEATFGPGADAPATPATAVDCPGARALVQRICELADHICELGDKAVTDEDKAEIARLCAEAKARCARARTRTEDRCPGR